MTITIFVSLLNVTLGAVSAAGLFRIAGAWRKLAQEEEDALRKSGFDKDGCCLRVRLSFAKAGRKIEEVCGAMGLGIFALIATAIVLCVIALGTRHVLAAGSPNGGAAAQATATSGSAGASIPPAPHTTNSMTSTNTVAPTGFNSAGEVVSMSVLLGANAVMLALLVAILASVAQLRMLASVLESGHDVWW